MFDLRFDSEGDRRVYFPEYSTIRLNMKAHVFVHETQTVLCGANTNMRKYFPQRLQVERMNSIKMKKTMLGYVKRTGVYNPFKYNCENCIKLITEIRANEIAVEKAIRAKKKADKIMRE